MQKTITLVYGNGGEENNQLIQEIFYRAFKNDILQKSEDAAVLPSFSKIAMSTDSFTVSPLFFRGGNIGKLSVCGTCNDLAMMGAKPKFLSISFIIEEGFLLKDLKKIVKSIKEELELNDAKIVTGDTKVMPKGTIDKLVINTTGIGEVKKDGISASSLKENDVILVSRDIGCHGGVIFLEREEVKMQSDLKSDCASLYPIVEKLIEADLNIKALRDATRGGIGALLNEWARKSNVCIEIEQKQIPVSQEVNGICELLGFEPMYLANEGTFCVAVDQKDASFALEILRSFNPNASIIGKVTSNYPQKVVLHNEYGTKRFLEMPTGELLPRIC